MFGDIPKLFDRNYIIAYFIPVAAFIVANMFIYADLNIFTLLTLQLKSNVWTGTANVAVVSWFGGILLLATNRRIIRIFEGYGKYNPLKLMQWKENSRYLKLQSEIQELDTCFKTCLSNNESFPDEKRFKRNRLMQQMAVQFPDKMELLLPTSFGNALRAFEVYPRIMYGFEAIQGWSRLLTIIPKDYRDIIDSAKAQVDFWVNLGFVCFIFVVEYFIISIYQQQTNNYYILPSALILSLISFSRAKSSVVEWGEFVKASFDIYLPSLKKTIDIPISEENMEQVWTLYSQAIIYRHPSAMKKAREFNIEKSKEIL